MAKNYSLTAVVLSKDSEKEIGRCLKSLLGWADEIIIVDGQSSDSTVKIAQESGAKVYSHPFLGSFAEERNFGTQRASGTWVLQLDTDEVLTEAFKNEVTRILNTRDSFVAYKFLRKNFFLGHFMRYGGWYHYSLHLFKRGFARYLGRVHHDLLVDGKIGALNVEIEHYPFQNLSQFIERQNRYTSLEAEELVELKKDLSLKEVQYNMKVKPIKLFWKFYVKKQGFREGMYGFIFSVLFAWVHFLKWVKVWEILESKS